MSGTSNVGGRGVYEAGDQRTAPNSEINERERYKEGKEHSHLPNDSSTCPRVSGFSRWISKAKLS